MSLITDERIEPTKSELRATGCRVAVQARKSADDPCGRKLYFVLEGPTELERQVRGIIRKRFPDSSLTSGVWGRETFGVTIAEFADLGNARKKMGRKKNPTPTKAELRAITSADAICNALFTNAERSLGGWCRQAVHDVIVRQLKEQVNG